MTLEDIEKKFIPLKDPPRSTYKKLEIINFTNKIVENTFKNIIKILKIDEISLLYSFKLYPLKSRY